MFPREKWANILFYPKGYNYVPKREINGAGPKGYGWLVKDTIGCISITEAANVHDAYYYLAKVPRSVADKIFLQNMLKIIEVESKNKWHRYYCNSVAYGYYLAVRLFGGCCYKG